MDNNSGDHLNKYEKLSLFFYGLMLIPSYIGGIVYMLRSSFMPYHADAVQQPWEQLSEGMQTLILAMLNGAGGLSLSGSIAITILLVIPFRQRQLWAYWSIPVIAMVNNLAILLPTIQVKMNTVANPPWPIPVFLVACTLLGFIFSIPLAKRKQS